MATLLSDNEIKAKEIPIKKVIAFLHKKICQKYLQKIIPSKKSKSQLNLTAKTIS